MVRNALHQVATALLGGLLLCWACAIQAQTITNVAQASWGPPGSTRSTQSNAVVLTVSSPQAAIESLRIAPGSNLSLAFQPSMCGGKEVSMGSGSATGRPVDVQETDALRIGEQLLVRIRALSANIDPSRRESLALTVTTSGGDQDTFEVLEVEADSGVFVGNIPTVGTPPQAQQGDCRLSVAAGDTVSIAASGPGLGEPVRAGPVRILADPFGIVFDSQSGAPVSGARVTLIDADTGAAAMVLSDDGLTNWPSTVVSGEAVTDGAGIVHPMLPGEFRFPLAALGSYRLQIEPPASFSAPSTVSPGRLAQLTRPGGGTFTIVPASFGGMLSLVSAAPVAVDIPVDPPLDQSLTLTKSVSRTAAAPGDVAFYTIVVANPAAQTVTGVRLTDSASSALRLRPESVRVDGAAAAGDLTLSPDGREFTLDLGDQPGGTHKRITYAAVVRDDAPVGDALNRVAVTSNNGPAVFASASLRVERETIASRMTLIGRVTRGDCGAGSRGTGVSGVRLTLEDGSFAITDEDGRYHFEGLLPGFHVVQAASSTLPGANAAFVDCARSTRSAGSSSSRFISGQGGSLVTADFVARFDDPVSPTEQLQPVLSDAVAAGAEVDFLAAGDGPPAWLFPDEDHNPRAPAVRVAIRHRPGQKIELSAGGRLVDPIAFDGVTTAPSGAFAVSVWRGIPLERGTTQLVAIVRESDGAVAARLARDVHFATTPARATLLPERSRLVADGKTRPVLAVRIVDRDGRPVHSGLTGELSLNRPYESAEALDRMQLDQLTTSSTASPRWFVAGDDGVAMIELAPTLVSGAVHAQFSFVDGDVRRNQTIEAWMVPGQQEWTLVGLIEGKAALRSENASSPADPILDAKGRVAFYAKGRVLGSTLLTIAYDSREKPDERLLGLIDPRAYYSVFADGSERRFDATSREKLYVRVESSVFYALYGDFETGFDQTTLARYQRAATGLKGEARRGQLQGSAFAAKIASRHRHDEFQGNGLSGPYNLSSRTLIANSETVAIERRDRFRSELVLERKVLIRFIDYRVDPLSGTISFTQPVLSRDSALNPQIIVVDYESDSADSGALNAGLRATWTNPGGSLRVGATAITDEDEGGRTNLGAADIRVKIGQATELRGEIAASERDSTAKLGWLLEAEHHDEAIDILAYARSLDPDFGVAQQSAAERGRRKFGIDARVALNAQLSLTGSTWLDESSSDATRRVAAQVRADVHTGDTEGRLGVTWFGDRLANREHVTSAVLEGGMSRRMLDNKLEVDVSTSIGLPKTESIDLPARHRLGARYDLSSWAKLVGSYEIASGDAVDARTTRAGVELTPWSGARLTTTVGQSDIHEQGKRSFAAFGVSQSWQASPEWVLDATVDGNRVLGNFDATRIINPDHPVASGGFLSDGGLLSEDFTAVTFGAGYRSGRWSATARAEYRDAEFVDRKGLTFGAIRQLGEGSAVGSGFAWTHAESVDGSVSEILDAAISSAWRPANKPLAALAKLEYREDRVIVSSASPEQWTGRTRIGGDGDAQARRFIASLSTNWSPQGRDEQRTVQRSELAVFVGGRYGLDSFENVKLSGLSLLGGLDARVGLGDRFEIGVGGTIRTNRSDDTTSFSVGPSLGFVPANDMLLTLGYNFAGYRDPDFSSLRTTDRGFTAGVKIKFDTTSLSFLGLGAP